ncbi:hypothetical protein B296_00036042 [Ensete ventricosum]|uniref:Uncharacterized protein n=1 Tax=Ensete ventricosum TaxID=4639 RepID=A0A426YGT6_ENSVE|nr:hypothetical protein B296_00036042 [Ensete ventricosum]
MKKHPRQTNELQISFEAGDAEYPDHKDALVISIYIANAQVERVMVNIGSLAIVLYHDAFQKLGLTVADLSPMSSTLTGFTNDYHPLGTIVLPINLRQEPRSKTRMVTFMVVNLPSMYNVILSQSTLNKLRVVISTYHRAMKCEDPS